MNNFAPPVSGHIVLADRWTAVSSDGCLANIQPFGTELKLQSSELKYIP